MENDLEGVTPLRGASDQRRGTAASMQNSLGADPNLASSQPSPSRPGLASAASPLSRRRQTASQASFLGSSQGMGLARDAAVTEGSQYGATPQAIRRVRFARADIGDMGREFLLLDNEMQKLPELPRDVIQPDLEREFEGFVESFRLQDFAGVVDATDEEKRLMTLDLGAEWREAARALGDPPPLYMLKLLHFLFAHGGSASGSAAGGSASNNALTFAVSLEHLFCFNPSLYHAVVNAPQDATAAFDAILRRKICELKEMHGLFGGDLGDDVLLQQAPRLRVHSKPAALKDELRSLDPSADLERLVCLKGVVIRVSEVLPEMTLAAFRCLARDRNGVAICNHELYECVINGDVQQPQRCPACSSLNSLSLWLESCSFASKQLIKIAEIPENINAGETPQTLAVYAYDDLVDSCRPGDRVEISGVFKASPTRLNPRLRFQHSVFRTYVTLLHVSKDERDRTRVSATAELSAETGDEDDALQGTGISSELEAKIKELAARPDIYDLLIKSFAPSLIGRDDVKKGILCQLVGGTQLQRKDKTQKFRSDIHILLCGDPATAKSQLLQYVHQIAPRCMYTSGRGSSAVGLTVAVTRDPDTKEFVLESGAVVLAHRGVCCIDEFDKMEDTARAILHEVMEQQTVTVAKAGIVASLKAQTAILASANPVNSRYDRQRAVIENINLPPSLFSRFDLIYLLLDTANPEADRRLAEKLCGSFAGSREAEEAAANSPPLPKFLLSAYLSYCRQNAHPVLTPAARDILRTEFLRMRRRDVSSAHPTASVRQLEALLRLSEANAKLRLSSQVGEADAAEAVRLLHVATLQSLVDPFSGRIDFDQIHIGVSRHQRVLQQRCSEAVQQVLLAAAAAKSSALSKDELYTKVVELLRLGGGGGIALDASTLQAALQQLETDRLVTRTAGGLYQAALVA